MSRTSLPCSSSARPDRRPAPPESGGPRRVPPFRQRLQSYSRGTRLCRFHRARCERLQSALLHLLDDLLQLLRHGSDWFARKLYFTIRTLSRHDVELTRFLALCREIVTKVCAAAFFSFQRCFGHDFRNRQQVPEIERGVPAGVVFAIAIDADLLAPRFQFANSFERLLHLLFGADDADQVLHHVL